MTLRNCNYEPLVFSIFHRKVLDSRHCRPKSKSNFVHALPKSVSCNTFLPALRDCVSSKTSGASLNGKKVKPRCVSRFVSPMGSALKKKPKKKMQSCSV